jgi:hypothetical protein
VRLTPLSAQPWSSSTFGWVGVDYIVEQRIDRTEFSRTEFTATWGEALGTQRLDVVPLFTIGVENAADIHDLVQAERCQSIREARVLETECSDLVPFQATVGRYMIFVPRGCGRRLADRLGADANLLIRLAIIMLRYQPLLLKLTIGGEAAGLLLDRLFMLGRYHVPRTGDLTTDLTRYAQVLGDIGTLAIDMPMAAPCRLDDLPLADHATGYWQAPIPRPCDAKERLFVLNCLNSYPSFLLNVRRGSGIWTCLANEWYDQRAVLRKYVGLEADIQIHGKVQHGWQSGCGVDGERGYKPEAMEHGFPIFLWSRRNMAAAGADGLRNVTAIGAPFLYYEAGPDPGPADRTLLCFPYHSVPEYPINADWVRFGESVLATAREHGFEGATVCLHHHDADNVGAREALRGLGLEVVTVGHALAPGFLDRLVLLIRGHAAVTSDRICTAGFYAEMLGRPFFVSGEALRSDPPDPDVGLGADRDWIAREFPEFLHFDGRTHRETALRELGADFIRPREELRTLLYGWYL